MRKRVQLTLLALTISAGLCGCGETGRGSRARADPSPTLASRLGNGISPARVVIEPQDGIRPVLRAIDAAQNQIFVEAYILTERRIIRALERAAAQGVAVYVQLEHKPLGMGSQPERVADELRAASVAVRWSRPTFSLTHAKFIVLDDRQSLVATANFSKAAFQNNREILIFDRDAADVYEISALFRADWDRLHTTPEDPNLVVSPDNARAKLLALIARARKTIEIYGEEIADLGIERALIRSADRGIRVHLILPWDASPAAAALLSRGGVKVRELKFPYIHAKLMDVDGREAFVGSENLSTASLDRNREVGVLLRGTVLERLARVFAADWRRATPFGVTSGQR